MAWYTTPFWLQENISDLELRVDWLGSKDIIYFSVRQSMQPFTLGRRQAGLFPGNIGLVSIVLLLEEVCRECGAVLLGGGPQACLVLAVSIFEFFC